MNSRWLILMAGMAACRPDPATEFVEVFRYDRVEEGPFALPNHRYTYPASGLQFTGWGVYEDIIFPGTAILWSMAHTADTALSDPALRLAITGGDAYNNAFFTSTVAMKWAGETWPLPMPDRMVYALDFFPAGLLSAAHPDESEAEGLEWTFQQVVLPSSWGFALQWAKSGEVRYWNDEVNPATGKPFAWQSFPKPVQLFISSKQWHHLEIEGYLEDNTLIYKQFTLDGIRHELGDVRVNAVPPPAGYAENFLQVGFQINGNKATHTGHGMGTDPFTVYIDQLSLTGYQSLP